jgi:hypothetical protein
MLILVAAAHTIAWQGTSPQPAEIAGRVVDAVTGRPIAGVIVTPAGPAVPAASPTSALTNGNGLFAIRGLRAGKVFLTATKGGYVPATYNQRHPGASGQFIPLQDGERVTDLVVRMWKHAVISGTILDEAGDPVVGTRVLAMAQTFITGRRRAVPGSSAITDDRGMYRISGLTPGDYIVAVPSTQTSAPTDVMESFFNGTPITEATRLELGHEFGAIGSAIAPAGSSYAMRAGSQTISLPPGTLTPIASATGTLVYPTVYYPAASTPGRASAVSLRSGEERGGIDVQVQPLRGVRVSGMLLTTDGPSPTTGIHLVLAGDDAIEPIQAATTLTDGAGAFAFPAVPPGDYVLRVVRIPRAPVDLDAATRLSTTPSGTLTISSRPAPPPAGPPPIPADATLVADMPLSIADRDVTDLIVPLVPGPRVTGRLEFDGTVEPPTGSSIANMRITLDPADGTRSIDETLATQTGHPDESGQFKTYGVPPGRYVLRVSPLPAGWFLESALYQGRDIADMPLELGSKDVDGVVITFTDRPSRLAGVVRSADGPDPTAIVIAYPIDPAAWTSSGAMSRRMRTVRASRDGSYSMPSLPAGEYYLAAVQEERLGVAGPGVAAGALTDRADHPPRRRRSEDDRPARRGDSLVPRIRRSRREPLGTHPC